MKCLKDETSYPLLSVSPSANVGLLLKVWAGVMGRVRGCVEEKSEEFEGCKYTFACPRHLVVMSDLFPDGEEGDKTRRTEPSEKEATEK